MPSCTVIPVLGYPDVGEAVDWLCDPFGFRVRWRAGSHRAQLSLGDGSIAVTALTDGEAVDSSDHSVMVRIEDAERHHEHARERGARILQPPTDFPYAERQYSAEDYARRR